MHALFGFCLRFFASFVLAKLLLRLLDADRTGWLLGLALLLTLNLYWLDYEEIRRHFHKWWVNAARSHKHKNEQQVLSLPAPPDPPGSAS